MGFACVLEQRLVDFGRVLQHRHVWLVRQDVAWGGHGVGAAPSRGQPVVAASARPPRPAATAAPRSTRLARRPPRRRRRAREPVDRVVLYPSPALRLPLCARCPPFVAAAARW